MLTIARAANKLSAGAVASVTASPSGPLELSTEETQQLTVTARNAEGVVLSLAGRRVTYSTSNAAVATVSESGLITGVAEGTCTITPRVDGFAGTGVSVEVAGAGAAAQLAYATQPGGAVLDTPFTIQPVIRIEDSGGNLVTDSTAEVTIAVQSGDGTLSGDVTVNAVDGIATFTDLELDAAGTHVLRVTSSGLTLADSSSFNVTDPGAAPAILFAAQWRTVGTGSSDINDGGRFQNSPGALSVIEAGDAHITLTGWPTANALRVSTDIAASARMSYGLLPELGIGVTRYHRIYMAYTEDAIEDSEVPGDSSAHPIENIHNGTPSGVNADEEYGIGTWRRHNGATLFPNWCPSFMASNPDADHFKYATNSSFPQTLVVLPRNVVNRFEWAITRINSTQYTMQVRLYNAAGTQIADENNFYLEGVGVMAGRTFTFVNVDSARAIGVGNNESAHFAEGASPQSYQGALAISDESWPGPYNDTTEPVWDD